MLGVVGQQCCVHGAVRLNIVEHFAGWKFCSRGWSIPTKLLVHMEELCSRSVLREQNPSSVSSLKERFLIGWKSLGGPQGPGWSRPLEYFAFFINWNEYWFSCLLVFCFLEDLEEGIFSLMMYYDFEMKNKSPTTVQSAAKGKTLWGLVAAIFGTNNARKSLDKLYLNVTFFILSLKLVSSLKHFSSFLMFFLRLANTYFQVPTGLLSPPLYLEKAL